MAGPLLLPSRAQLGFCGQDGMFSPAAFCTVLATLCLSCVIPRSACDPWLRIFFELSMTPILEQPQIQDAMPPCGGAMDSWGAWTFAPPEPSVSSLRGGLAHCEGHRTRGRGSTGGRAWVHSSGFRISMPMGPPGTWWESHRPRGSRSCSLSRVPLCPTLAQGFARFVFSGLSAAL